MTFAPLNQVKMQPFDGGKQLTAQSRPKNSAELAPLAKPAAPTTQEKLETQVKNWLGQTFFGTLLKQMRDSPFKSELFSGGRGEEAFGSLYDANLSQRMAHGMGGRIARPIIKKLEKQAAAAYKKSQEATFMQKERYGANG